MIDMKKLSQKIGYCFQSTKLFKQSMIHKSIGENNNERLEFLGDSVLSLAISDYIYSEYSSYNEGEMSQLKAHLVQSKTLSHIAKRLGLESFLQINVINVLNDKMLEDACEALIGAIYLDSKSFNKTAKIVIGWYKIFNVSFEMIKNPKQEIMQFTQNAKIPLPLYCLLREEGSEHDKNFFVSVTVGEKCYEGKGKSIKEAEKEAAIQALRELKCTE